MDPEALDDLADRWRRARAAAARPLAPGDADGSDADGDEAQKRAFEYSLRLGRGFVKHHHTPLALSDLPELFRRLTMPCLQGSLRAIDGEAALVLERAGCAEGAPACDVHREAIAGLLLGLTGTVRHARHDSLRHGGERCVDVLYEDAESRLRFGAIPDSARGAIESVKRLVRAFDSSVELSFLGVSEGALFYRITRDAGGVGVQSLVERTLRRRLPSLVPVEISPRPVLAPDDPQH